MHLEYDEAVAIGYLVTTAGERAGIEAGRVVGKTIDAGHGVLIDLDGEGNVLGVEVFDDGEV